MLPRLLRKGVTEATDTVPNPWPPCNPPVASTPFPRTVVISTSEKGLAFEVAVVRLLQTVRIPMKPAIDSDLKPAIDSDLKPASHSDFIPASIPI